MELLAIVILSTFGMLAMYRIGKTDGYAEGFSDGELEERNRLLQELIDNSLNDPTQFHNFN